MMLVCVCDLLARRRCIYFARGDAVVGTGKRILQISFLFFILSCSSSRRSRVIIMGIVAYIAF
jgi:hypothetical protein